MDAPMENLCGKLRDVVNSTNIFYEDVKEKVNYDVICAMMDRVDESMDYIITHPDIPKNNDEQLLLLNHVCIVADVIKCLFGRLGLEYNSLERHLPKFLDCVCYNPPFNLAPEQIPSDDSVVEYIRSISFAHPLETNRGHLIRQIHDEHCSPFLMLNRALCDVEHIGVYVYSTHSHKSFPIQFPYKGLRSYVYARYGLIAYIIDELERRIQNKEDIWRKRTVKRDLGEPGLILDDVLSIMTERYQSTYDVAMLKSLLTYPYTNRKNDVAVAQVQRVALSVIPEICNAIDEMDNDKLYDALEKVLYTRPKNMHQMAYYQLEKIFAYLNDRVSPSDKRWGLMQADEFSKEFAKNWVEIDVATMDCEEIKLLTTIACFLEAQKQNQGA